MLVKDLPTIQKNGIFGVFKSVKQMTSAKKKLFATVVAKVRFMYRLSESTTLLPISIFKEIDIIEIELRSPSSKIPDLLEVMDRMIPNFVLFVLRFENSTKLSASIKHPHPSVSDTAVVDWTFSGDWYPLTELPVEIMLEKNLNEVFHSVCKQLSHFQSYPGILSELIEKEMTYKSLTTEIAKETKALDACIQFNKKVDINSRLRILKGELENL